MQELWRDVKRLAKEELGYDIFLTCTYRDNLEQNRLFAQGRTADGPVITNARAGQSPHNVAPPEGSHAFDFAVLNPHGRVTWDVSKYIAVAAIARRLGADCGAFWDDFTDPPHIQMPGWKIGKTYGPSFRFVPRGRPARPTLERKPIEKTVRIMRASDNAQIAEGTLVADKVYLSPEAIQAIRAAKE
jgi:peptidoglycan L-alanyl-D-glutamate endopeptidase CwlK